MSNHVISTEKAPGQSQQQGLSAETFSAVVNFTTPPEIVSPQDVEEAWREQVAAVDRWEWLAERSAPQADEARARVQIATAKANALQRAYRMQYETQYIPTKTYPDYLLEAQAAAREALDDYIWLIDNKITHWPAREQARDELEIAQRKADEAWDAFLDGADHLPIPF